jgi:hypothetical protein
MDAPVTPDVFTSPALGMLRQLEADGFHVELMADGALSIAPRSRLTAERMRAIAECKAALKTLLQCCDDGTQARRRVFAQQFAEAAGPMVPALLYRADVPYTRGRCFSCGDALPELRFGRCWRCALAWRLACCQPIRAEIAVVMDTAKVSG